MKHELNLPAALRLWGYLLLGYAALLFLSLVANLGRLLQEPRFVVPFVWELAIPTVYVAVSAIGLLRLKPWARTMSIMGASLCLIKALYDVLLATQLPYFRVVSIIKIPVAGTLLFYLTRPNIKTLFQGTQPIAAEVESSAISPPIRWIAYICSFLPIFGFVLYFIFRRRDSRFAQNCLGMAVLGLLIYSFLQTRSHIRP